jgi:hypothetical protein
MVALDQRWFDSRNYLPENEVVLKRYTSIAPDVRPWAFPRSLVRDRNLLDDLDSACGTAAPERLCVPTRLRGDPCSRCARGARCEDAIDDLIRIEVVIPARSCDRQNDRRCEEDSIAATQYERETHRKKIGKPRRPPPFPIDRPFDQSDFPGLVDAVLAEMKDDLGDPHVGTPDRLP